MQLTGIFIYPVKSLGGFGVPAAAVDALGFAGDHRFMIVDESGSFLTQRTLPRMALVRTALVADRLVLSASGLQSLEVSRNSDLQAEVQRVSVWRSEDLSAEDCGNAAAAWLSHFLQVKCRLVRLGGEFDRPVLKPSAEPTDAVSFADSCPFLLVSEASLADLNDRLVARGEEALPMNRFRPNLVVNGCDAFAEDTWSRFKIGDLVFRSAGPCARCVVTTTNQDTAERGKEPLRTLASYRRDPTDPTEVNFGQNLIHETKSGMLRIGDKVELL